MTNYYELHITRTARPMGNNTDWSTYDDETKNFYSLDDIKKYLKEQYFYTKTIRPMYQEDKNGNAVKSGYIYCYKSDPVSYGDCKHYNQDWISIHKIKSSLVNW